MSRSDGSSRRAMIAKVHIARKELAMDEATYRAVLLRITRQSRSAACDSRMLVAVLDEFKRLGWKPPARTSAAVGTGDKPHVAKIRALWAEMAPLLASGGTEDALRAFVRRQTRSRKSPDGVGAPEWLDGVEGNRVIEGLKAWHARLLRAEAETKETADV